MLCESTGWPRVMRPHRRRLRSHASARSDAAGDVPRTILVEGSRIQCECGRQISAAWVGHLGPRSPALSGAEGCCSANDGFGTAGALQKAHVTVETVDETTITAALGAQRRACGLHRRRLCSHASVGSGAAGDVPGTILVKGGHIQCGRWRLVLCVWDCRVPAAHGP